MKPLISINLCCFNSEKYLRETLLSIANQTYGNWELVVVDDGSTDTTGSIISDFKKDGHPVTYYYQQNKGLAAARNKALSLSKGDYIAFIDHDDLWLPDKLRKQIQIAHEDSNEKAALVYSRSVWFGEDGEEHDAAPRYAGCNMPEGRILYNLLMEDDFITLSSVMARRDVCLSLGGFPEDYRYAEDYYLFAAIAARCDIRCVQSVCCKYRVHEKNVTRQLKTAGFKEKLAVFNKWSPFLGKEVSAELKQVKIRELQTLIGAMMIKYDKRYAAGCWHVLARGSVPVLFKETWRYLWSR